MPHIEQLVEHIAHKNIQQQFANIYGGRPEILSAQTDRYRKLLSYFGRSHSVSEEVSLFSTPGRTEVGGNHTDHNAGRVLAAAIDLDIIAAVSKHSRNEIVIESEGFQTFSVNLDNLEAVGSEQNTSASLVRGICARMTGLRYTIGGFDAAVMSSVPHGSGLSSSAAFEVLVVSILDHLYNCNTIDPLSRAQIGQYAENVYFGKPCGLMDQSTCSAGGFVTIDFADFEQPSVKKIDYDFGSSGYSLAIVNTGGSHADLTEHYAAIKIEMIEVAKALGSDVLRGVSEETMRSSIPMLREKTTDRAILRAIHFYDDNRRVTEQVDALERNDFGEFLRLVIESGNSSWMKCQNSYTVKTPLQQPVSLALAVSESILKGRGAWRVHGGGFAGTIQAFVPDDLKDEYFTQMRAIFGPDSCHDLSIRQEGSIRIDI